MAFDNLLRVSGNQLVVRGAKAMSFFSGSALLSVLILWIATVPTAWASGNAAERVKKAGKVLIAMDATYPPMESEGKDGKVTGFDVDFANELAKRLGVKAEFVVMSWEGILAGLTSNRYDLIISAMNITPDRQKQVDFVEYARMSQIFISKKGQNIAQEKDLAGKVVTTQVDTTSFQYVEKAKARGVAIKGIKSFQMAPECFAAVRAGQADVIVIDEPVGRFFVKQDPTHFIITGRAVSPEPVGIALRKGEAELSKELTRIVDDMKKDGTLKRLFDQWFGGELGA